MSSPAVSAASMFRVPLFKPDLPAFDLLGQDFRGILESGRLSNFGEYVNRFEAASSAYLGTYVATAASGTTGLILALQALGLAPGQKVIVPSFTFMATAQAVLYAGGVLLFAEIDDDMTLSPVDLEYLLARHDVAAIIPVHAHGLPCQVDAIQQVVAGAAHRRASPIAVLYDAAHAFGAAIDGRRVGGFGNAEVFSLSGTKIVTSVEGGLIASHNPQIIERVRAMRNYGMRTPYETHFRGLNGKMSEIHAAIGLRSLERIELVLGERQHKARAYLAMIRERTSFQTIPWPDGVIHTCKDITVLVPPGLAGQRDTIVDYLREREIETRTYFSPPLHQQPIFRQYADRPLPRTEAFAARVINLPFFTHITYQELEYVINELHAAEQRFH
jgi:dTDP-4-amino-4,6-dideoxygalactose transaminase